MPIAVDTTTALLAFQAAGSDTVVMGPAGSGAHAAVEWVDVASAARLAEILVYVAAGCCGRA